MTNFELIERAPQLNSYLLIVALVALTFVAYARLSTPSVLSVSWLRFWKMSRIESFGFDEDKIRPTTQVLLLANYFVSFGLCTLLYLKDALSTQDAGLISLLLVFLYSVYQVLNFRLALLITDLWKLKTYLAEVNKQIWSFMGLILLLLTFLWLINSHEIQLFKGSFIIVLICSHFWRLIKAWRICGQANLEWYYLILYLCALEIAPLLFIWSWFSGEYTH